MDTRTKPETEPSNKPPAQYDGGSQTQTFTPREGRTPTGRNNGLGHGFFIPQDSKFGNSIMPVIPRTSGGGGTRNLKTLIFAMREAQNTTRDLINVIKDKNNNGETTTNSSGDNNGEAKELDNAINALVNAQREVTHLINNTEMSTRSEIISDKNETQPPWEAAKTRDPPTNDTEEGKDISALITAMRKASLTTWRKRRRRPGT